MTKPMGLIYTTNDPDLIIMFHAMLVTVNLFMAPIFTMLMYPLAGQFELELNPKPRPLYCHKVVDANSGEIIAFFEGTLCGRNEALNFMRNNYSLYPTMQIVKSQLDK
jgi:hypothetical protein